MAFAGGAKQVRAPDKQIARVVLPLSGCFAGEADIARFQRLNGVLLRRQACCLSAGFDVQRVEVELRRRRQPAHTLGADVEVDQVTGESGCIRQRRKQLLRCQLLIAPLAGVVVKNEVLFIWRGGRFQSSAKASGSQPVCGRSFSWPT